jgi:hypothetical protein
MAKPAADACLAVCLGPGLLGDGTGPGPDAGCRQRSWPESATGGPGARSPQERAWL